MEFSEFTPEQLAKVLTYLLKMPFNEKNVKLPLYPTANELLTRAFGKKWWKNWDPSVAQIGFAARWNLTGWDELHGLNNACRKQPGRFYYDIHEETITYTLPAEKPNPSDEESESSSDEFE